LKTPPECLLNAVGLPERIEGVSQAKIFKSMSFDKKFSGKTNRWVLLKGIGSVVIKDSVPMQHIVSAIKRMRNKPKRTEKNFSSKRSRAPRAGIVYCSSYGSIPRIQQK